MELPPTGLGIQFSAPVPSVTQPGSAATRAGKAGKDLLDLTHSVIFVFVLCS